MKLALFSSVVLALTMPSAILARSTLQYTDKMLDLPIMASSRGASSVVPKQMGVAFFPELMDILPSNFLPRSVEAPNKPRGYQYKRQTKQHQAARRAAADVELQQRANETHTLAARAPTLRFGYGGEKVRGVSLGGWLVVENFIAPSVYAATGNPKIIDEWSFGALQSKSKAASILQRHLDTFIGEDDFRQIAALGLNHVRIPIGYWAFEVADGEPYTKLNQWALLKQAALWAGKYNLKVLVDLHAIPGSANGYDHGGQKGVNTFANKKSYLHRTLAILNTMSVEFSKNKYANSVSAIELVNEPILADDVLLDLYYKGYNAVRNPSSGTESPLLVVIGDGFKSPAYGSNFWNGKFLWPKYEGVALDSHIYTIFDDNSIRLKSADRISFYCSLKSKWAAANANIYSIVGEWTPAFTDCAVGLNGRGSGARYDGTFAGSRGKINSCGPKSGSAAGFSTGYKTLLGKMWEAQVDANEGGSGWIMWTWKTEAGKSEDWSYQKGVQYGWIPADPTQRPNGIRC